MSSSAASVATARDRVSVSPGAVPFWIPVTLFVVSGATGLIDQLCFSKYLSYIVGSTAYAVSAVLAAFMTGLALGAHLGGRWSRKVTRPLFAYGILELVVALTVALGPTAFAALTPLYVSLARSAPGSLALLSVLRWALAMLVVIVPTTAMGATLPLLSRALGDGAAASRAEREERERRLGALYTANTVGGALGALGAAYVILPLLGLDHTLIASAVGSASIGVAALFVARRGGLSSPASEAPREADEPLDAEPSTRELVQLLVLAFVSGWLVFAAEVVFTHLLALVIGNSAYAFGLILAVFLGCLSIGAARAPAAQRRFGTSALPLGLAAAGLALAATLPLWDVLPLMFAGTGKAITTFAGRELMRALAAFLILCLPVTLMGLTFPLLLQRVARTATVGHLVGRLTAVNTIGAVLGSMATGYLILPALGAQKTLGAVALVLAIAGAATARSLSSRRWPLGLAAAALAAVLLAPAWNLARLTSGTNVYFDGAAKPDEIVMMREDIHGGVTTVTRKDTIYTLYTNGKFQGNNGWELNAQRFFAHYPSLFVKHFDHVLVIGCGTGTTLGTLAAYPWKGMDLVEISPAIVEAAHTYFDGPNRGALDDPRLKLHLGDGRNFLLVGQDRYDLISMELSSVWFAGASSLYSREYYRLVHQHLKDGGIFQQWVQLHHVERRDFATLVNTLRDEFSHVALFYGGGQGILVASDEPLTASRQHLVELQADPTFAQTVPNARPLTSLTDDILVLDHGLDAFLDESASLAGRRREKMLSTDDNLYLEYATPRGNVLPWSAREALVEDLRAHRNDAEIRAMIR
ncbi:MAG: fused MFS/spermidine synthase [Myxococcales bacterium]|nr:fused MFS/spermidine synthase [Myxococcales bacterium]MCB9580803.1 fused MFS/spermidine synthase [Polyangiaceae bacterium]